MNRSQRYRGDSRQRLVKRAVYLLVVPAGNKNNLAKHWPRWVRGGERAIYPFSLNQYAHRVMGCLQAWLLLATSLIRSPFRPVVVLHPSRSAAVGWICWCAGATHFSSSCLRFRDGGPLGGGLPIAVSKTQRVHGLLQGKRGGCGPNPLAGGWSLCLSGPSDSQRRWVASSLHYNSLIPFQNHWKSVSICSKFKPKLFKN